YEYLMTDDQGMEGEGASLRRVGGRGGRRAFLTCAILQAEAPRRTVTAQGAETIKDVVRRRDNSSATRFAAERGPIGIGRGPFLFPLVAQRLQQVGVVSLAPGQRALGLAMMGTVTVEFTGPWNTGIAEETRQELFRLDASGIEGRIGIDECDSARRLV